MAYLDLGIRNLHETSHLQPVFILCLDDHLLIGGMLHGEFLGRVRNAGDEFEFVFELGDGPGRSEATLGADCGRGDADWYVTCGFHSAMQSSQHGTTYGGRRALRNNGEAEAEAEAEAGEGSRVRVGVGAGWEVEVEVEVEIEDEAEMEVEIGV